jgi:hypothetical protein
MRKFLLVVCVLLTAVFTVSAQETTWINPLAPSPVAGSMLSSVASGMIYDEIDIIFLSPAELSNYTGITFFTAYGNYEYNWVQGNGILNSGVTTPINPLTTNAPTQGVDIGNFLFGVGMPLMSWRLGALAGFRFGRVDNFLTGATVYADLHTEDTVAVDGDADDDRDYSYTNIRNYTDVNGTLRFAAEAGMDLGFIGVSLLAYFDSTGRSLGGIYTYELDQGDDATYPMIDDAIAEKSVHIGSAEGNTVGYPTLTGTNFTFAANAELPPISFIGFSIPITAGITAAGSPYDSVTPWGLNPPVTVSWTVTNVTGATSATADSVLTYTTGDTAMDSGWDPQAGGLGWVITGNPNMDQAAMRAAALAAEAGADALDMANYQNSLLTFGLSGRADPVLPLGSSMKLKTRGSLAYTVGFGGYSIPGTLSVDYTEQNATNESVYSYSHTISNPQGIFSNEFDIELGGIVEFKDSTGFLTLGAGLIYNPNIALVSTTYQEGVEVATWSWEDPTVADEAAGNVAIGWGGDEGTRTETTTTTWGNGGAGGTTSISNTFYLPVAARLNLVKDALSLVGGYILDFTVGTRTTTTPQSTSATVVEVENTGGTNVYTTPDDAASTSSTGSVTSTTASTVWNGAMNFMVRWTPAPGLTVDFFGQSIMNALDFNLFAVNDADRAFNPDRFITNLGISVTLKI